MKIIKDTKLSLETDADQILNDLKEENKKLRLKMENLLNCDECDKIFDDKDLFISHIKLNHFGISFKCKICDEGFSVKDALTGHITKHHRKVIKDKLLERMNELDMQINIQKKEIFNAILQLKKKETKENGSCYSKGRFCAINHSRFRWNLSKSDSFLDKVNLPNAIFSCHKCDKKFEDKNDIVSHIKLNHSRRSFKCEQCHKEFGEKFNMKKHMVSEHES